MSYESPRYGGGARGSGARRDWDEMEPVARSAARATTAEGEPAHQGRSGIRWKRMEPPDWDGWRMGEQGAGRATAPAGADGRAGLLRWLSCKRPDGPSSVLSVSLEIGSSALQHTPPIGISAPGGHEPPGGFVGEVYGSARQPKEAVAMATA